MATWVIISKLDAGSTLLLEGRVKMQPSSDQDALSRRVDFLKNVSPFAKLSQAGLAALVGDFRLREYAKDELVFRQGDTSCEFYIIFSGKVRIFKNSLSGNETSIIIFSTHDIIGEFATIDNRPRSATAKAIMPTSLLQMQQEKFLNHMRTIPDLAIAMSELLVKKIRWTANFAETVAQYDAPGRLLHTLLLYNAQFGQAIEAGKRYEIDLGLTQSGLASLVGARREWINRLLQDWRKRGLLEYEAGKIIILDLPRVEAERDSRLEANQSEW